VSDGEMEKNIFLTKRTTLVFEIGLFVRERTARKRVFFGADDNRIHWGGKSRGGNLGVRDFNSAARPQVPLWFLLT